MNVNMKLLLGQSAVLFLLFALCLFLPAGTLAWPAGWAFLLLFFGFYAGISAWLFRHNPGLLTERMRLGTSDQQGWDKVLFPLMLMFTFLWLIFIPLDAVRFHWSQMPLVAQAAGAVILLASFFLLFLTFRENSYLSPVVRVQQERGHTVISTGPNHYVRHPMYAASMVFVVGTSLLLGSWYGILLGLLFVLVVARRAVLEERTLQVNLQGYTAYMAQVRYRLIPHVW